MRHLPIILSVMLSALLFSCSEKPKTEVLDLSDWKFATGDNMDWAQPGFDDTTWKPIEAGRGWEIQGYAGYDGYAWYRVKFNLPSGLKKETLFKDSLQLMVGQVDDCDQAFLNGKLLGQNGKTFSNGNDTPLADMTKLPMAFDITRKYILSVNDSRLNWDGENILAVRVCDFGGKGGIISMPQNVRMRGLTDYLVFKSPSNILEPGTDGTFSPVIIVKNNSPLPELKGILSMQVARGNSSEVIASKSYEVNLGKEPLSFSFNFKGDSLQAFKATFTFTEAKSGSKAVYVLGTGCSGGWVKYKGNPVLGGDLGTIFDISIIKSDAGIYQMYNSWRDKGCIAVSESSDGFKWSTPEICLRLDSVKWKQAVKGLNRSDKKYWEGFVNRPFVIKKDGIYHMWYTSQGWYPSQCDGRSWIEYATSSDGKNWTNKSNKPVLTPEHPWENVNVMLPNVMWDEQEKIYKMWYSAGEQSDPDAIGYATSKDCIHWGKYKNNPIFTRNTKNEWEQAKVACCQVIKRENDYLMFYIGFQNIFRAQVGMARSKDGITNWERYSENPVIRPGNGWEASAVYKTFAIRDTANNRWLLYYNGRLEGHEQIGVAIHQGIDLGF